MRHEQLKEKESFDLIDAAAIWPAAGLGIQGPLGEVEAGLEARATPAVPDMPVAIGRAIAAAYAGLIGIFFLTMARGAEASFMIVISALYVMVFLAVPAIFLRIEKDGSRRPTMDRFMEQGIDTWTGHMSGGSAVAQIFAVPVLLGLGLLVIGVAARWYLP